MAAIAMGVTGDSFKTMCHFKPHTACELWCKSVKTTLPVKLLYKLKFDSLFENLKKLNQYT
jgi:hypothetical protein